jgi:leucyl/phenylalanyl-tRNA--protein transferase
VPVYRLSDELVFPPPEGASREGLVAIGGDASPERLLLGYAQGIFPWPHEGYPLLWFSPDPRFVLVPTRAHLPRSLRKVMRRGTYEVRFDTRFVDVMRGCQEAYRPGQDGTWITDELVEGYGALHRLGFAHSVESYRDGELVGGLYGVGLGRMFFGESMFARAPDASKVAFAVLLAHLARWGFEIVDCQVHTEHLARFGAVEVRRKSFLATLRAAVAHETRRGPWQVELGASEAAALLHDAP